MRPRLSASRTEKPRRYNHVLRKECIVVTLIQNRLGEPRTLCRRHGVARLEVFGSAAHPATFDAQRSDIDFIVVFARDTEQGPWLASYFNRLDDLQHLLDRRVDLVMERAMHNPYVVLDANRTRQVVYAAQDAEAA